MFEANLEHELLRLARDINAGTYRHGGYSHKIVSENKRRDIYVATVRDRVVHRLLYDYLQPLVDPRLDPDVWSCRPGKGLHGALERTQSLARRCEGGWAYRGDVRKFFDHVDHVVLAQALRRYTPDTTALRLIDEVLGSYAAAGRAIGMPIGNLTSQLFANVYLNEFDRFVRCSVKPRGYVRYGDDFVLFGGTHQQAVAMGRECQRFLAARLFLETHPANQAVVKVTSGLHFLGHRIYPHSFVVSPRQQRKIRRQAAASNASSAAAQALPHRLRRDLPWRLHGVLNLTEELV